MLERRRRKAGSRSFALPQQRRQSGPGRLQVCGLQLWSREPLPLHFRLPPAHLAALQAARHFQALHRAGAWHLGPLCLPHPFPCHRRATSSPSVLTSAHSTAVYIDLP